MPSLIQRIATRLGFTPTRVALASAQAAARAASGRVMHHAASQRRTLLAALTTPDVSSWQEDGAHLNTETAAGLAVVRARSRGAAKNNEFARRFLGMVRSNVLGPFGVRYQARLRTAAGALRKADNDRLEAGWQASAQAGWWDITGRYTRRAFDRIGLRHVAVDGEAFIRIRPGRGPHGVQFQLLTSDAVPLTTSVDLGGGRRIRQGIEFDADGVVLAYHMRTDDTTLDIVGVLGTSGTHRLVRVPASEMLHVFLPEEAGQLRGVPWMQAALKRMWQASDFASAGLNKARESAKRGGFIQPDKEAQQEGDTNPSVVDASGDGSGTTYTSLQDGTWEKLLPGETAQAFESEYPNIEYGQFIKDCVRGIAAALDCAYFTLGNDLEAVNYSSGQLGMEGERAMWMGLQEWWMDTVTKPLHRIWLKHALVAAPELAGLAFDKLDLYAAAGNFSPHRWQPLDPLKTIEAQRSRIEARLTSPQRVIAEGGADPDEIVAELLEWQEKTSGLKAAVPATGGQPQAQQDEAAQDAAAAARQAMRLRLIATRSDE